MKSRTTNYEGLPCRALLGIGLSVLGLFLAGCSPGQSTAPRPGPSSRAVSIVPTLPPLDMVELYGLLAGAMFGWLWPH